MSQALDTCTALLGERNLQAFFHVIGAGESNEQLDDAAYRICNAGPPLKEWKHPWYGRTTTEVGHSTAAGAFQFLGTSWKEASDALGLGNEFTPINQQLATAWTIAYKRRAMAEVLAGNIIGAVARLKDEWVSLPGLTLTRARSIFAKYGGTVAGVAPEPAAQIDAGATQTGQQAIPPQPQPKTPRTPDSGRIPSSRTPMPALALLSAFAPILQTLIPQIAALFDPTKKVAERNLGIAQVVVDTIVQATGKANLPEAVGAMTDPVTGPEVTKAVQQAVVTHPDIMGVLEIGGGIAKAREFGVAVQNADKPFWYNPTFWITALFFPMMYMITYQVLFTLAGPILMGTGVEGAPMVPTPWYAQIGFDSNTRTGLINLIVGFVFGGICGIWFGTTVAKQRSEAATTTQIIEDRRQ